MSASFITDIRKPGSEVTSSEAALATHGELPVDSNHQGWVPHTSLLWDRRRFLAKVFACALLLSTLIAFLIPKQYESTARMMPPEQQGMGTAMLAALAGKAMPGGLGALAGSFLGMKDSGALFVDLLRSGTIEGAIVDRFDLQKVYWNRYRQDSLKKLRRRTEITQDRKSGVITITVTDTDRRRARDMAQAYVDQLDSLLIRVNTSAARREREWIEQRLVTVQNDLEKAQLAMSDFAGKNTTLDIKEETKAMVDAGAKLQAQLIVAHAEADSLAQFYGEGNVRMRAANARVGELEHELKKLGGSPMKAGEELDSDALYPSLRQLPALAVRWADLYRQVKVKETVYDLLTEQYELARIEEVKSVPSVRIIDPPGWPEKKSFPPRLIIMLCTTVFCVFVAAMILVLQDRWLRLSPHDPRKELALRIWLALKQDSSDLRHFVRRLPSASKS
jgi:capsule polysaccharide export protein KpsE/RkpR